MRYIPIAIILILSVVIIHLTDQMQDRPYNSDDMRGAYYHGCNYGTVYGKPLNSESVKRCEKTADIFKNTIDTIEMPE